MPRRQISAADVQVDETGLLLFGAAACSSFVGGTKTVASQATPEPLVAEPAPCRGVWVGARCDADGAPLNEKPCFIGDAAGQNFPIMPANFEGATISIDDAARLYVKVGVAGEGVVYRILA